MVEDQEGVTKFVYLVTELRNGNNDNQNEFK